MLDFKSLVKIDEKFVGLDNISSIMLENIDWNYVEGKILILNNEKLIFGLDVIDDINWFWGFIADSFNEFFESGIYDIGFPSQPIRFTLKKINKNKLNLNISSKNKIYLERDFIFDDFLYGILNGAKAYYLFENKFNRGDELEIQRKFLLIEKLIKKI